MDRQRSVRTFKRSFIFSGKPPSGHSSPRLSFGLVARVTLVTMALSMGMSACNKKAPKEEPKSPTQRAQDALSGTSGGYDLQDLKPLSGHLVRIINGTETLGPTSAHGFLISSNTVLAHGYKCAPSELGIVFQSQGDDQFTDLKALKTEVRKVTLCEDFRTVLSRKLSESSPISPLLSELQKIADKYPNFTLAKLQFEGGLPDFKEPKWSAVVPTNATLTLSSSSSELKSWESLSGKLVAMAGFARDEVKSEGQISRRIWLPFRVQSGITGESDLIFSLQTWFPEGDRAPFASYSAWLEGPDQIFHAGLIFSGVTRFPNVRPFTEIQTLSPTSLGLVISWDKNENETGALAYSARCVDSAPFIALLKD